MLRVTVCCALVVLALGWFVADKIRNADARTVKGVQTSSPPPADPPQAAEPQPPQGQGHGGGKGKGHP